MDCICHYSHLKPETITVINTEEQVTKLTDCANQWVAIGKEPEYSIARNLLATGVNTDTYYHRQCYLRFASQSKLDRASAVDRKRVSKIIIKLY